MRSTADLEETVLASQNGTPIRIKDVGQVVLGPDIRRGTSDLDGRGEAVSGIVIMRQGSNALDVIARVKARLHEIDPGMPAGVRVVPIYDRSELIQRAISNSRRTLIEVVITVVVVILIFLWHFPSAVIPVVTIPVAVLMTFIPLYFLGVSINILSLAGIALACGELVDAAIVVVEQTYKKLELHQRAGEPVLLRGRHPRSRSRSGRTHLLRPAGDRGGVSARAGAGRPGRQALSPARLCQKLCPAGRGHSRADAGPGSAPAAGTQSPRTKRESSPRLQRLRNWLLGGALRREDEHPIMGPLMRIYDPVLRWTLRWKWQVIGGATHTRGADDSGGAEPGIGIDAAHRRGITALHAQHHARHLHRGSPEAAGGDRQHPRALPRSGSRSGQGRARRYRYRSRTALDARDHHRSQAAVAVAEARCVVFVLGPRVDAAAAPAHHLGPHFGRAAGRGDE